MDRRQFMRAVGAVALVGSTGCLGGEKAPPPRKSDVISDIEPSTDTLRIEFPDDPWVVSRYTRNDQHSLVGVAAAKGGGGPASRGFTGRTGSSYHSAPTTTHGRAWYFGGGYTDDWYEDHDDETTRYRVEIRKVGVRHFGSEAEFEDLAPGPGPVTWDQTVTKRSDEVAYDLPTAGWYRIGAHIYGRKSGHDFGWECVDCKLVGAGDDLTVEREWKVSPRI